MVSERIMISALERINSRDGFFDRAIRGVIALGGDRLERAM